jgi:hypothetical protein
MHNKIDVPKKIKATFNLERREYYTLVYMVTSREFEGNQSELYGLGVYKDYNICWILIQQHVKEWEFL